MKIFSALPRELVRSEIKLPAFCRLCFKVSGDLKSQEGLSLSSSSSYAKTPAPKVPPNSPAETPNATTL